MEMLEYGFRSKVVMILAVQIIVLLCLAQPVLGEEILVQKAGTLSEGEYYANTFVGSFGDSVKIVLESDEDVDLILTSPEGYWDYMIPGEEFMRYSEGSSLRVRQTILNFFLPADGVYYVIVDNTDLPSSGAVPIGDVSYSVEVSRTGEPSSVGLTLAACGISTVIVLVILTTVIYLFVIRPRQKEMAAKEEPPVFHMSESDRPMNCPACGTYSASGRYCAKCQRRLR